MLLDKKTIEDIKTGIANLEKADVTPMGVAVYQNHWQLFKFKALPGHPNPKNAKHGFSHPTDAKAFLTSKGDANIDLRAITSVDEAHKTAHEIGKALGFTDAEVGQIVSTGEIDQIVLLRGGAQDFLTNDIQLGNMDTISDKERSHLNTEESETDNFVTNAWGGKRPGAGRPATGAKPNRTIRLSDEEYEKVKEFVKQLRREDK